MQRQDRVKVEDRMKMEYRVREEKVNMKKKQGSSHSKLSLKNLKEKGKKNNSGSMTTSLMLTSAFHSPSVKRKTNLNVNADTNYHSAKPNTNTNSYKTLKDMNRFSSQSYLIRHNPYLPNNP